MLVGFFDTSFQLIRRWFRRLNHFRCGRSRLGRVVKNVEDRIWQNGSDLTLYSIFCTLGCIFWSLNFWRLFGGRSSFFPSQQYLHSVQFIFPFFVLTYNFPKHGLFLFYSLVVLTLVDWLLKSEFAKLIVETFLIVFHWFELSITFNHLAIL